MATMVTVPRDSYACDPEPFHGDLNHCCGFLLQCRLVISQRSRLFPTDAAKINYIISLLHGKALAWVQASNSDVQLSLLSLKDCVRKFERIFDRPNHAGCASDRLFVLRQGSQSVAEYSVEFYMLAAE